MRFSSRLLSSLLLGTPLIGHAQSPGLPSAPHFYGGLSVYSSSHQNLGSWGNGQTRIPVQAVVGYQMRPRVAVQLGLAYNGNSTSYAYSTSYSSYYPAPLSTVTDYAGRYTERNATASLLARYILTRQAAHRFQADVLGGAKVEYLHYQNEGTETTHDQAAPVATTYKYPSIDTQLAISLGIGLRYRLVSRLEATYDWTFDQPLYSSFYDGKRLQATMALGLRYHFNPG